MYVWDTSTGELVTGKQYSEPSTLGEWSAVKISGRRTIYQVGEGTVDCFYCSYLPTMDEDQRGWEAGGRVTSKKNG